MPVEARSRRCAKSKKTAWKLIRALGSEGDRYRFPIRTVRLFGVGLPAQAAYLPSCLALLRERASLMGEVSVLCFHGRAGRLFRRAIRIPPATANP